MPQEPSTRDEFAAGREAARVIEGVRDWLASGERVIPPALAELPDDERAQVMNAGREFRDALDARLAELDRNRPGQEGQR